MVNKMCLVAIITAIAILIGLISVKVMGPNNTIEEACEEVIKEETGIDLELTTKNKDSYDQSVKLNEK